MPVATIIPARPGCLSRVRGIRSPRARARSTFPTAKRASMSLHYTPPTEDVDAEYPVILTTGRVVSHFLSGTQTRRIGPLVDQYPEPRVEIHPQLASSWASPTAIGRRRIAARRIHAARSGGEDDSADTVFIPYHWAGAKSANQLTIAAQDPISKIPEYKVCAVRFSKGGRAARVRRLRTATIEVLTDARPQDQFFHRSESLHRLRVVRAGVQECDTHKGHSMIHLEYVIVPIRRRRCRWCACTAIRQPVPRSARPTPSTRTEDGVVQTARKPRCIACNNCVLACPFGVPKMNTRDEPDDEVRHVLRPHVGGQTADVRVGLPEPGAVFGTREEIDRLAAFAPINRVHFGAQMITTKVRMMVPKESRHEDLDVTAAMYESVSTQAVGDDPIMANLEQSAEAWTIATRRL